MFGIGMTELMVILVIGLVVLGPKRLPEMARSLGRAMGEFRRTTSELRQQLTEPLDDIRIQQERSSEADSKPTAAPESKAAADGESQGEPDGG